MDGRDVMPSGRQIDVVRLDDGTVRVIQPEGTGVTTLVLEKN
jgi:hypothetical protein